MPFPFLRLPRELRNAIYAYSASPTVPPSTSLSLHLSCKAIHSEYTYESTLALSSFLARINTQSHGIRVLPRRFSGLAKRCIRISLSTEFFTDHRPVGASVRQGLACMGVLRLVFDGYFEGVALVFYEDGGVAFGMDHVRWVNRYVVHGLGRRVGGGRIGRVVVEVPVSSGEKCGRWIEMAVRARGARPAVSGMGMVVVKYTDVRGRGRCSALHWIWM